MHLVYISQVITESELVNKSAQLEQAMEYGNFIDYCKNKADLTTDQHKKYIWHFLRAHFEENSQSELLNLLGYRLEDINNKLDQVVGNLSVDDISDGISNLHAVNMSELFKIYFKYLFYSKMISIIWVVETILRGF